MKNYCRSFHRMIGTQFVVVNASNSVRIWKNLHGGVFITEESASAQEENIRARHIRVSRTKERSEEGLNPPMYVDYHRTWNDNSFSGFQDIPAMYETGVGSTFCTWCGVKKKTTLRVIQEVTESFSW